jgi:hypothetical protein
MVGCRENVTVVEENTGKPRTKGEYGREVGSHASSQLLDFSSEKLPLGRIAIKLL